jgi:hypothetical protein
MTRSACGRGRAIESAHSGGLLVGRCDTEPGRRPNVMNAMRRLRFIDVVGGPMFPDHAQLAGRAANSRAGSPTGCRAPRAGSGGLVLGIGGAERS